MGMILKDDEGMVLFSASKREEQCFRPVIAEALTQVECETSFR